ncbi:MAG: hypothetical protein ACKVQS_06190 [Fimbriimonadaceae bacterium]
MANVTTRSLLGAAIIMVPLAASAQVGVLSDTMSSKLGKGEKEVKLSFRSFDENEAKIYGNLAFYYGLNDSFDIVLRASGAEFTNVGLTRTGGTDIEIQAIWRKNNIYVAVGGAKPSTPANDKPVATWTAGWQGQDEGRSVFFGVTGLTSDDVTIIAASAALRTPLSDKLSFDASSMFLIRGDNTADVLGNLGDEPVFNFALRYAMDSGKSFWVSAGNSLGDTTGFSMSHRLQRGFGLGAGVQVKF